MTASGETRFDPLLPVLLVLTGTTGLIDAISVLGLGHVFTANMTGNVAFLGFAAAGVPGFSAVRCGWALAAFLIGAVAGGMIAARMYRTQRRWLLIAATIECALFATSAALSAGYGVATELPVARVMALLGLTASAMGVRNATVRRLGVPDLTTTVLTLTLTGLGADSNFAGGDNPRWKRRILAVVAMFIGAALGAWLMLRSGLTLPLAIASAGALAPIVYIWHPASQGEPNATLQR
jgi:uncharacterized membrane protein YoaK (UPF0700 family)